MPIVGPEFYMGFPTLGVSEKYLLMIADGSKTVEGRKKKAERDLWLNKGVVFWNDAAGPSDFHGRRKVLVQITAICCYPDVKSFVRTEWYKALLPDAASEMEAIQLYERLYPAADVILAGGICGLAVKVVNDNF